MPSFLSSLAARLTPFDALTQRGLGRLAPAATFHLAALGIMVWSEIGAYRMAMFVFSWALLNCFWLALLRRPGLSAALSFAMLVSLVVISRFKFSVLWMTASFIDVMIIDADTVAFLWMIFPKVRTIAIIMLVLAIPLAVLIWKLDPFRVRRRIAILGTALCLAAIAGLSLLNPVEHGESFGNENYVSHFVR